MKNISKHPSNFFISLKDREEKLEKKKSTILNMRKNFTWRVAENWNRLPREGMECPSPETLNAHLDEFVSFVI